MTVLNKHGQIVSVDYPAIKAYCLAQPASTNKTLNIFVNWAKGKKQTKMNLKRGSYGLKHEVESLSDILGKHEYCGNEEFIIAMVQAGFDLRNEYDYKSIRGTYGPNYHFNLKRFTDREMKLLAEATDGVTRVHIDVEAREKREMARRKKIYDAERLIYFKDITNTAHIKILNHWQGFTSCMDFSGFYLAKQAAKIYNACMIEDYRIEHLPINSGNDLLDKQNAEEWTMWQYNRDKLGCVSRFTDNKKLTLHCKDFILTFIIKKLNDKQMLDVNKIEACYLHFNKDSAKAITALNLWATAMTLKFGV